MQIRYSGKWMIGVTDVPHFQMATHQNDQCRQLEKYHITKTPNQRILRLLQFKEKCVVFLPYRCLSWVSECMCLCLCVCMYMYPDATFEYVSH